MNIRAEIEKLEGTTLSTLDQSKPFDILEVSNQDIIIRPHETAKERKIRRNEVEDAFRRLVAIGELTRSEIREEFSNFNPAYVAAILAELPDVKYSRKPIRLWVTGSS
jgi:hypothetical protein